MYYSSSSRTLAPINCCKTRGTLLLFSRIHLECRGTCLRPAEGLPISWPCGALHCTNTFFGQTLCNKSYRSIAFSGTRKYSMTNSKPLLKVAPGFPSRVTVTRSTFFQSLGSLLPFSVPLLGRITSYIHQVILPLQLPSFVGQRIVWAILSTKSPLTPQDPSFCDEQVHTCKFYITSIPPVLCCTWVIL